MDASVVAAPISSPSLLMTAVPRAPSLPLAARRISFAMPAMLLIRRIAFHVAGRWVISQQRATRAVWRVRNMPPARPPGSNAMWGSASTAHPTAAMTAAPFAQDVLLEQLARHRRSRAWPALV